MVWQWQLLSQTVQTGRILQWEVLDLELRGACFLVKALPPNTTYPHTYPYPKDYYTVDRFHCSHIYLYRCVRIHYVQLCSQLVQCTWVSSCIHLHMLMQSDLLDPYSPLLLYHAEVYMWGTSGVVPRPSCVFSVLCGENWEDLYSQFYNVMMMKWMWFWTRFQISAYPSTQRIDSVGHIRCTQSPVTL